MIRALMTSTKPFEKDTFGAIENHNIQWTYTEAALNDTTFKMALGFDAVCVFVTDRLSGACLKKLKDSGVKLIALRSAGFNHVDVSAAKELGMRVVRVPRYSPQAVAEFSVGLYLALNRKIYRAHDRVREGNFSLNGLIGHDIHVQTIGVVGAGAIGKCVAQIFRGFGSKVLAFDTFKDEAWASQQNVTYTGLEELLAQSDVVTLHAPLTPDTKHVINERTLKVMKRGSYLVNTSRGALVDTTALISALKHRHLSGAALDVYEEEEQIFFKDLSEEIIDDDTFAVLNALPNVLVTSHQAFLTYEALNQIAFTTIKSVTQWINGEALDPSVILA